METDFPNLDETVVAAARLIGSLSELTDDDMRAPSLLPGWSRGHVVAHLARNADALSAVLRGAQDGDVRAMYTSDEARDQDIEAGATRSHAELLADLISACGRWVQAANEIHASRLDGTYTRLPGGIEHPIRAVPTMRRREVEIHHADLGLEYTPLEWPADFVDELLALRAAELGEGGMSFTLAPLDRPEKLSVGAGGAVVAGTAADLAWWLVGRGTGEDLDTSEGTLPEIGRWR